MSPSSSATKSTRVILLRHGQSTFNERKLYQGCSDESLLNEVGTKQANLSGEFLKNCDDDIDLIYASPLQRTHATAIEICKVISADTNHLLPINLHPNLKEINLPSWQGLPFKYVRENLRKEYRMWEETPHEFTLETITSSGATLVKAQTKPVIELYQKAAEFWQEILPQYPGKTILIVSHGGTIRALISTALGINPSLFHRIQQSNCGISILNFHNHVNSELNHDFDEIITFPQLEAINLTQHLNEQLPKLKNGKHGLRLILLPINSANSQINPSRLHQIIQSSNINFCISCNLDDIHQEQINQILEQNSTKPIANLQVSLQNFFPLWHRTICNSNRNTNSLNTGIVVADTETIRSIFHQILDIESNSPKIDIQSDKISLIFYPSSQDSPVIQAMNICL